MRIEKIQGTKKRQIEIAKQQKVIFDVLEWLWDSFVEPVLCELGYTAKISDSSLWPRVWWCPTGIVSSLPIHAAGYHKAQLEGRTVIDRVVSSYTSSIRALKYSRDRIESSKNHSALIIATPTNDLRFAEDEAYRIECILKEQEKMEVMNNIEVEVLCNHLPSRSMVHFICHAVCDPDPSSSRLLLKDGNLMVAQISQLKINAGALAYLSACSTALSQAESLEDECITLSNAFQLAGFAGVVGSLWKTDDRASFDLAVSFYAHLKANPDNAADALHHGVLDLRQKFPDEPSLWACYTYTGV